MNHYFCPYNGAQFYGEYTKCMGKFQKEGAHSYLDRALALKLVPLYSRPHFSHREKKPMPLIRDKRCIFCRIHALSFFIKNNYYFLRKSAPFCCGITRDYRL